MAFKGSVTAMGKKQALMPRVRGAGTAVHGKKPLAVVSSAGNGASGCKSGRKGKKSVAAFSTVESRQKALERVRRAIWANLDVINDGIMKLAAAGNYLAAKALFDLAGVYTLPDVERAVGSMAAETAKVEAETKTKSLEPAASEPAQRVQAFLQTLGIERPPDDPEEVNC